ncbi:MAG: GntR family transcriptional regulator [Paracoccus sp. (in: a-proteobacteria)]
MLDNDNESAADRAYRLLSRAIMTGGLPTDHKVTETGLAEFLGMSRTPLREAVNRLLLEGVLERRAGQGLWCVLPTREEMSEIFDLRARLESYAAGRAALRASDAQKEALNASVRRMAALVDAVREVPDDTVIARIDDENAVFHRLIIEAAQARRLEFLLRSTVNVGLVSLTFQRYSAAQRQRSVNHHEEIAEAIAAGRSDWAASAMETHVLSAVSSLIVPSGKAP